MKDIKEAEIEMWCDADRVSRMTEEEKEKAPDLQSIVDAYHGIMMNN